MQTIEDILLHSDEIGIGDEVRKTMKKLSVNQYGSNLSWVEESYALTRKRLKLDAFEKSIVNWKSSLIQKTEYDSFLNQLLITFNNREEYLYEDISSEEYLNFCSADSQGTFFIQNFKNKNKSFTKK